MRTISARLALIPIFLIILGGCATIRGDGKNAPPGRIVAISLFKCNCEPLIRETVQDSFVDIFFNYTNAKPVKGENGDITIMGIITMGEGQTGRAKGLVVGGSSGSAAGGASGSSASGDYLAGITIQAYKNGELIATYSVGQDLGQGTLNSPVTLAQDAAWQMAKILARKNEIGYK